MKYSFIPLTVLLFTWQPTSILVSSQIYFTRGLPRVTLIGEGPISGLVKFSREGRPYNAFIGIPYAKVPERFSEPKLIREPTWQGILNATKPGAICPQMSYNGLSNNTFGDEDCLFLNVYVPDISNNGKHSLPVMVWIHGGGFIVGSGTEYDPEFFMDEDVAIITVNYRLGVYGFLSTGDTVIPGNNGLKDMILALKWVQQNIKIFGGDPDKVTIFGESAGGAAVHLLMLSPVSKGLFHRAISQSGSALSLYAFTPNPKQFAIELATYLRCPTSANKSSDISSMEILICLQRVTSEELNRAQFAFKKGWVPYMPPLYFSATAEPNNIVSSLTPFLTEPPISIVTRNNSKLLNIPWLIGAAENELAAAAGFILSKSDKLNDLNSNWENIAPSVFEYDKYIGKNDQQKVSEKLKQFYFGKENISDITRASLRHVFSDELTLHGVYRSALETASRSKGQGETNQIYLYQYAYKGPLHFMAMNFRISGEEADMVGHADDLQHLFHYGALLPGIGEVIRRGTPDEQFSKHFVKLWASFAIYGEPRHSWGNFTFNYWKPISNQELNGTDPLKWFRIEANPGSLDIETSVKERMQFWDYLWSEYFTPAITAKFYVPIVQKPKRKINSN